ncbi:MAG: HAMP domain-containing histidine kinase [bacterium]|nr:HAMP domain-containing histidine kinase [bacterium]
MKRRTNLLVRIKNILKEVRFGNFSNRLPEDAAEEDKEFVIDFNNMLESLQDRENMISENQGIFLAKTEYLKNLFDMLNEGIISVNKDLKILSVNKTQAKWFRIKHKKLFGMKLPDVLSKYKIYSENGEELTKKYDEFFKQSRTNCILTFELKKLRMTFSVTVKKFLDNDKNENYFIISKDISSDIKLQKLKDTFLATLTHDLKVPIVAEEKVLQLLLNESLGKTSAVQKEALENMLSNNKDMLSLVNTLLDVYKLEDGVFQINKAKFNFSELVCDEVEKVKFIASEAGVSIKISDSAKIKEIIADETQIGRVIKNLLTNAINFAPQGSEVRVDVFNNDNKICVSVSDCGSGILPENIPHVFDRYYTKKYRKVGTGLGLYLSKKIVRLHGGDIKAESVPDKKTTFTVELPIDV